jgi:hypothetical protein
MSVMKEPEVDPIGELREELGEAREEIAKLRIKATTTLTGTEFLTLIFLLPIVSAFVILGIIIVWKTTSNPAEVAPYLDIILLALAIFSNPVSASLGLIVGRYADEKSMKK